jgi:hypothetical protein
MIQLQASDEWSLLGYYAECLLCRTEVSAEPSASIIRVTRISELGTLAVAYLMCMLSVFCM